MKNQIKHFLLLAIMACSSLLSAQSAVQYMEKITKEFNKISEETWDYTRAVAHKKQGKLIENKRKEMLNANRSALNRIKNMQPFKGDASYRDSTVRYLELSYMVLNNDYSKIVDMEEISEQSYDAMEAYMTAQELANDKLEAAFEVASKAQKDFAAQNNINLVENDSKTAEKLEKASEVFKYYNKIYLAFFKPYKQEIYLIEALSKGDVNGMKQNQESLSKLSKEAITKIKAIQAYKNNTTLKVNVTDVLEFYIMEADKKIPLLVDFMMKKEKFDKLKAVMDKKGQSASKSEIDEYNAAIKEMNATSNGFNNINNELNNKRAHVLDTWNNSVSRYLDKNVSNKK